MPYVTRKGKWMMNKYFYKVCKHCIKAHNIYERTANKDQPKYITEVNNEEMAKFMTEAMNKFER